MIVAATVFRVFLIWVSVFVLVGCAVGRYGSGQSDSRLRVCADPPKIVFASYDAINEEARNRGYTSQANGFYDRMSHEVWVPLPWQRETLGLDALRTIGHELARACLPEYSAMYGRRRVAR